MRFSQRIGKQPIKTTFQVEGVDQELRNGLWDAVTLCFWTKAGEHYRHISLSPLLPTFQRLWHNFYKLPVDTVPVDPMSAIGFIRERYFKAEWYHIYDFHEFLAAEDTSQVDVDAFIRFCNTVLERELSAYRFVGGRVARITEETEITSIESALEQSEPLIPVRQHLENALAKLADRKQPDYRNSIKEAISAVEAIAQAVTGEAGTTLGQALKVIGEHVPIHPAFRDALTKLYGYTSDADGIRHALLDADRVSFTDAKFMLVLASAFVSYVVGKSAEVSLELRPPKRA